MCVGEGIKKDTRRDIGRVAEVGMGHQGATCLEAGGSVCHLVDKIVMTAWFTSCRE